MIQKYFLYFVWVIATISSLLGIYLIEAQHWNLSRLGWYELICMIPMTVTAGMAAWDGFHGMARYLLPQSLLGFGISIYHLYLQLICPIAYQTIRFCDPEKNVITLNFHLNYAAFFAGAFLLINVLLVMLLRMRKREVLCANR